MNKWTMHRGYIVEDNTGRVEKIEPFSGDNSDPEKVKIYAWEQLMKIFPEWEKKVSEQESAEENAR